MLKQLAKTLKILFTEIILHRDGTTEKKDFHYKPFDPLADADDWSDFEVPKEKPLNTGDMDQFA